MHITDIHYPGYAEGSLEGAMSVEDNYINPIERSLLADLVDLYTCDLTVEKHKPAHGQCLACSKESIVRAILTYQDLDAHLREQELLAYRQALEREL